MTGGHSFEFTPGGLVAMEQTSNEANETIVPANPEMFRAPEQKHVAQKPLAPARKPLNIVKAAKARLREVKREINRLRKLEVERDELTRLISAAEQKPCAIVRTIAAKRG